MRIPPISLVLLALVAGCASMPTHQLPGVEPSAPSLLVGEELPVCQAFVRSWQTVHAGPGLAEEWDFDPRQIFGDASVTSVPDARKENVRSTLYGVSRTFPIDFDGDGDMEIIHMQGESYGWRLRGANFLLFEDWPTFWATAEERGTLHYKFRDRVRKTYRGRGTGLRPEEKAEIERQGVWANGLEIYPPKEKREFVQNLLSLRGAERAVLINDNGVLYTMSAPYMGFSHRYNLSELHRLNGADGPMLACRVQVLPTYESLAAFKEQSAFYHILSRMYAAGSGSACQGSMGWTAQPLEHPFLMAFHRPQAMQAEHERENDKVESLRPDVRQMLLMTWGASDPQSWQVYLRLKDASAEFIAQLAAYYRQHFPALAEGAEGHAAEAYRLIIDSLIYNPARIDGADYKLLGNKAIPAQGVRDDDSPAAIARAFNHYYRTERGGSSSPAAIAAALYTRQDVKEIEVLVKAMRQRWLLSAQENARRRNEPEPTELLPLPSEIVLASLGDVVLMDLIAREGGDFKAPTNHFGKTPLMYAAQADDAVSVRYLIAADADINARTKSTDRCNALRQDHRSALMYAAENAGEEVIRLLVGAGADTSVKDSQGNGLQWYLARNQILGDAAKARMAAVLGPPQPLSR
ncbi:ankyrin repeat domain-containing protein [Gimibacter soli]|uniref:Ankyrin repeat domain-containing protein n=1 Tax=Gimibacter soli TaxID=3024400 RepID=A0AAE9XWV2_9PROT|nr:ankyrin repeat domain-containing protein [Gimibacter soli]WCL54894.1 ankyrin repeat domain-containing protein [Gimibacter soli]